MPSLRSSGKIQGSSVSLRQLAAEHHLSFPVSMRELIAALGVRGSSEILFTFGTHNLTFANGEVDGAPGIGTFRRTFGAAEILREALDPLFGHPFLTAAFFLFYVDFLKKGGLVSVTGYCTALACLVADNFWTGRTDTPTLTVDSEREFLTFVHGKMLSRQSLLHFHDQGRQGAARTEKTCREVETLFLRGPSREDMPLVFFVPSGEVFDADYVDALNRSHCVMPYRFQYPQGHPGPQLSPDGTTTVNSLDGVELFVWDCNAPESDNCRFVFADRDGQLDFEYSIENQVQSALVDGLTLAMMTNGDYLLRDHDLPFSGVKGLQRFIIDFLLSPADLQITDPEGRRTGNFDRKIHAEIPDSHPCYLVPGAYLLPHDTTLTRRITGTGTGTYTFCSLTPEGASVAVEGMATTPGQVDVLSMTPDQTQVRFAPAVAKTFAMTIARRVGDQERVLALRGVGGTPESLVAIDASPELSFANVTNAGGTRSVEVEAFVLDRTTTEVRQRRLDAPSATAGEKFSIQVQDWATLQAEVL
jgi:hypothetical protein